MRVAYVRITSLLPLLALLLQGAVLSFAVAQPSQSVLTQSLFTTQTEQCMVRYPKSWSASVQGGKLTIKPGPSDSLDAYGFTFSFEQGNLSPFDLSYGLSISQAIDATVIHATYPAIGIAEAQVMKDERGRRAIEYNEGVLINSVVFQYVAQKAENLPKVPVSPPAAAISLHLGFVAEDGEGEVTENLQVRRDASDTTASATLFPYWPAQEISPSARAFNVSCSASSQIPIGAFKEVCRVLVERITRSQAFLHKSCTEQPEGSLRFAQ